jgi:hypothetical protein
MKRKMPISAGFEDEHYPHFIFSFQTAFEFFNKEVRKCFELPDSFAASFVIPA